MLDILTPIAAASDLSIQPEHRRPIAMVGAGGIVERGHLPAYRASGLDVVGIFDVDPARAAAVAELFGLETVFSSLDDLLGSEADVIDIAVPPWEQPAVVGAALEARKHVLCQKPLALDVDTAVGLVEAAERAGLKLAVNQQMRFEEGMAAARAMVREGWIGEALTMSINVNVDSDWTRWPWLASSDRLDLLYHSIHYLDSARAVLGDPIRVWCTGSRMPGRELPRGETRTISTLVFEGEVRAWVAVSHDNVSADNSAAFRIDGTRGSIVGTIGLLYDYPDGRPDTLAVNSQTVPTDGWLAYPVTRRWIPDAFAGPMGSLLEAISTGTEPATSGRDNLGTLRLVRALYESMDTGEAQNLSALGFELEAAQ